MQFNADKSKVCGNHTSPQCTQIFTESSLATIIPHSLNVPRLYQPHLYPLSRTAIWICIHSQVKQFRPAISPWVHHAEFAACTTEIQAVFVPSQHASEKYTSWEVTPQTVYFSDEFSISSGVYDSHCCKQCNWIRLKTAECGRSGGSAMERPKLPYATQRKSRQATQPIQVIQKVPRDSML